jgi:2-polyprenyl-3-methyl-5-hydroxy-6-metoxy-1,4-benzoquinol methylase
VFFGDPGSHLSDVLYLHFRHYKRELIYRFFSEAIAEMGVSPLAGLAIADIGASMGFDAKYICSRVTEGLTKPPIWGPTRVNLVEGDDHLIAVGQIEWTGFGERMGLRHQYFKSDLTEVLPLADASQDVVLCSEVVEHLERPDHLLREIHRILKPKGRLILTTDNSPSALQLARRVPVWLTGRYTASYHKPTKEHEVSGQVVTGGTARPIYGHINLNPTRHWERLARQAGFAVASFGTYESLRRGGGPKTPLILAAYFGLGFFVWLLPRRIGRFFGDTTALLLKKA